MEKKQQNNKDHSPISRNDFLTLFGLMLFDDEARRISAEMDEEDQDVDILDMVKDDFDEFDDDSDDDYDEDNS